MRLLLLILVFCSVAEAKRVTALGVRYETSNPLAHNYVEPQYLDPSIGADQEFISDLYDKGVLQPLSENCSYNFVFLGQDNRAPRVRSRIKLDDGRKALASRADIIQIINVNRCRANTEINMFATYRGNLVPSSCKTRHFNPGQRVTFSDYYFFTGRRGFLPCLLESHRRRVKKAGALDDVSAEDVSQIQFHGIFEVTRNDTIRPMFKDIYNIISSNKLRMLSAYGTSITRFVSVLVGDVNASDLLSDDFEEASEEDVNFRSVHLFLKERKHHGAGGYQRALNSSLFLTNMFGWFAYGTHYDHGIPALFQNAFNDNFSRSLNFEDFIDSVGGSEAIGSMGFSQGQPNSRIYLWGKSENSFASKVDGQIRFHNMKGDLRKLNFNLNVVPTPPSID